MSDSEEKSCFHTVDIYLQSLL